LKRASKDTSAAAWEFYDLQKDPREIHNSINDTHYSAIIKKMKTALLRLKKEGGDGNDVYPAMQEILSKEW
jgi:hypothetical protein